MRQIGVEKAFKDAYQTLKSIAGQARDWVSAQFLRSTWNGAGRESS